MKSTLSMFNDTVTSKIEDYCYKWNVNGDMWLSDFTALEKDEKNDKTYLESINEIRRQIIEPLEILKKSTINVTADKICEAFYDFLEKVHISTIISSCIKDGLGMNESEDNLLEIAREFKQLWRIFVGSIQSIYDNIGEEQISLKRNNFV